MWQVGKYVSCVSKDDFVLNVSKADTLDVCNHLDFNRNYVFLSVYTATFII